MEFNNKETGINFFISSNNFPSLKLTSEKPVLVLKLEEIFIIAVNKKIFKIINYKLLIIIFK